MTTFFIDDQAASSAMRLSLYSVAVCLLVAPWTFAAVVESPERTGHASEDEDGWVEQPVVKSIFTPKGCKVFSGHGDMVMLKVLGREVSSKKAVRINRLKEGEPMVLRIGRKSYGQMFDTAGDAACVGEKRTITVPEAHIPMLDREGAHKKTKEHGIHTVVWDVEVQRITKAAAAEMIDLWEQAEADQDGKLSPEEMYAWLGKHPDHANDTKEDKQVYIRNLLKLDKNKDRVLSWGEFSLEHKETHHEL